MINVIIAIGGFCAGAIFTIVVFQALRVDE